MRTFAALLGALMVVCLSGLPAHAHPLGNFTINHLVKARVDHGKVVIRYLLDVAEIPTFQIMRERGIEGPRSGVLLAEWARSEALTLRNGLEVRVDGQKLSLQTGMPFVTTRRGAGGLPTLYLAVELRAIYPAPNVRHVLAISDRNYLDRIGWKDIVVAPAREPTNELRSYPNALLGSPRATNQVQVDVAAGGRVIAQRSYTIPLSTPAGSASQMRSNLLSDMLARGIASPLFVLLTVVIAIGLGALHALEPGHGKTLLAVSLVGSRATARQAILLALSLTVAHTAGVVALGILLLACARWIVPENVYPWISLASGAFVAILGAVALSRFFRMRYGKMSDHEHSHGHGQESHPHQHFLPSGADKLSFRSVVLIAMSGNVAPCPAALVVLLTALTLHQGVYGLLVVIAFSVGLAATLTALGIAVVHGAAWISSRAKFDRVVRYGPLLTASIIALIGAIMVGKAAAGALQMPALPVALLVLTAISGFVLSRRHGHAHSHPLETELT